MTTSNTRPSNTLRICVGTTGLSMCILFAVEPSGDCVKYVLQIRRQIGDELHPPCIARMMKHESRRVEKWPLQALHRADVAGDPAVDAAIQRIADDGVADGAQ